MNTASKKAFTMIELIFVIVITGILASIVIPKLAATRDDAESVSCVSAAGQLISELSANYTRKGFVSFSNTNIQDMTNISTGGANSQGIVEIGTTKLANNGDLIRYECSHETVMTVTIARSGADFNLSVTSPDPATLTAPAAVKASTGLLEKISGLVVSPKVYQL